MTIGEKMCRECGVATSVHRTDFENASVMQAVIKQYLAGARMWYSWRSKDDWFLVESLPTNFSAFKYRVESIIEEE